jgi:hypothetical protein
MSTPANVADRFIILPSDQWQLVPLHWHAYTRPAPRDQAPQAALHTPAAVATWLGEHSEAHLWRQHWLIASRGDSILHNELAVRAVLNQNCQHRCLGNYLASRRRPPP